MLRKKHLQQEYQKGQGGQGRFIRIGASNDPLEQEADWVADQVPAAPGRFGARLHTVRAHHGALRPGYAAECVQHMASGQPRLRA